MLLDDSLKIKNKNFKETGDSRYIYKHQLDKASFEHDKAYGDFQVCLEEQLLIKYYIIKHLILLKIHNMMDINMDLLQ